MKKLLIPSLCLLAGFAWAQDFDGDLASARTAYSGGNLEDTRMSLQNALHDIDMKIGQEILKVLPTTMGQLPYQAKEDNVAGSSASYLGLFVHREFGNDTDNTETASVEIMSDSPALTGVNAILSMPMMMNSDPNQKVIKIGGYKSLYRITKDDDGTVTEYEVQVPFGKSMLTFDYNGDPGEQKFMDMANALPLAQIVKLAQ